MQTVRACPLNTESLSDEQARAYESGEKAVKQIWIPRTGEPSVLELRECDDPTPGPGQVRIDVAAAGVNFADLLARMGLYPDAPPLPAVVGYEVSGSIDAVGEGVSEQRIGTTVVALTRFGGYSSKVVVDEVQAAKRPAEIDAISAAAIPVNGLTAWMILEVMGRVREGDRVLVHSAGGGVGLMALDIIKMHGATAVGTASAHKHDVLRARGYDELIDYRSIDYERALKGQEGFDLVLDALGGDHWAKGLRLLRAGGRLACFGMSKSAVGQHGSKLRMLRTAMGIPWLATNPIALINANKGILGINLGHMWDEAARVRQWLDELLQHVLQGKLRPLVHATIPFDNAAEAHSILHRRKNIGKVVLTP